jgi:hypothetical protein
MIPRGRRQMKAAAIALAMVALSIGLACSGGGSCWNRPQSSIAAMAQTMTGINSKADTPHWNHQESHQ